MATASPERRVREALPSVANEDKALDRLGDEYEKMILRRRQDIEAARRLRALRKEADRAAEAAAPASSTKSVDLADHLRSEHEAALLAVGRLNNAKVADQVVTDRFKDGVYEFGQIIAARRATLCGLGADLRDALDRLATVKADIACQEHIHQELLAKKDELTQSVSNLQSAASRPVEKANDEWERLVGVLREEKRKVLDEQAEIQARVRKLRLEVQTLQETVETELRTRRS